MKSDFFSRWFLNNDIHIGHFYFHHFLLVECNARLCGSRAFMIYPKKIKSHGKLWVMFSTRQQHEAEFKEFEQWLKNLRRGSTFGWFQLNVYLMFQDLSRCSIETSFWRIWDSEQVVYYWYIQTLTGKAEQLHQTNDLLLER